MDIDFSLVPGWTVIVGEGAFSSPLQLEIANLEFMVLGACSFTVNGLI
jgi:hypothetical protein